MRRPFRIGTIDRACPVLRRGYHRSQTINFDAQSGVAGCRIIGRSTPRADQASGSGRRAREWLRKTIVVHSAGGAASTSRSPIPRSSMAAFAPAGRERWRPPPLRDSTTRSSETRSAPRAIRPAATDDFPEPDGPRSSSPRFDIDKAVPWILARSPSKGVGLGGDGNASIEGNQTGRPTTKRAPSGSDVMSMSVGRMFSVQMTPPCASTICLEIARPRPEWFPNCFSGRSE